MNHEIAMLHTGESPHPAHQGFAEKIGADLVPCSQNSIDMKKTELHQELIRGYQLNYDMIVSEGSRPLIASSISNIFSGTKLIYLCADQFFYDINYSTQENILKRD